MDRPRNLRTRSNHSRRHGNHRSFFEHEGISPSHSRRFVQVCRFEQRPPVRPWILHSLRTISCGGRVLRRVTQHRRIKNEDISAHRYVLTGATYCWVQQLPGSASPRTSRTARTSWPDRRYRPDRGQGAHGVHWRHGSTRPDRRYRPDWRQGPYRTHRRHGPNRPDWRHRANGKEWRSGCTRPGRAMSGRRASLYRPRFRKNELCQGLIQG